MRIILFLVCTIICLASCMQDDKNVGGSIAFRTTPVQSPSLLISPVLKCFADQQQMELAITVENLDESKITITEIGFNNPNGLNSSLENHFDRKLIIPAGGDTTVITTFQHINNKKLFHQTGLPGLIDSMYNLSVFYNLEGKEGTRVVNLVSKMSREQYSVYRKENDTPIQVYRINASKSFGEKQKQFLLAGNIVKTDPFVHATDQEIAISGLNFRVRCFHREDSLQLELFAVNHSEMTVTIDTASLKMMFDYISAHSPDAVLTIEKVTGAKEAATTLAKGDRIVLNLRMNIQDPPIKLSLTVAEAIHLANGKPLFSDNLELIQSPDDAY